MFRRLRIKWKVLFLIMVSCWVYGYLLLTGLRKTCVMSENRDCNISTSTEESYWLKKFKICEEGKKNASLGPGANGVGVHVNYNRLTETDRKQLKLGHERHDFNTFVSDLIPVHRPLPDLRPERCRRLHYPMNLPSASIVIIFRDELLSILLRTVYSILETTPDYLIKEIILVDDGSIIGELFTKLDIHISTLPKVSIIRLQTPKGLMVARQVGIEKSKSEYFVVMDSHMEVIPGWLEPLLFRLTQQPKALLCSRVGRIDDKDFRITFDNYNRTNFVAFNFHLDEQFNTYSNTFLQKYSNLTEPYETGMVQGMFIAMRKDFFLQLGGFDTGMRQWGTEQVELAVKVWTCGGTVEMVPCSIVAHLFRITPWGKNYTARLINKLRVADVWLDEYKFGVFHRHKHMKINYGKVTDRRKIRQENNCKPFRHFLEKVTEFNPDYYFPLKPRAAGRMRNVLRNYCIDANPPKMNLMFLPCTYDFCQYLLWTERYDIRYSGRFEFCLVPGPNHTVVFKPCKDNSPEDKWAYEKDKTIQNRGNCLTADVSQGHVTLQRCHGDNTQQWEWEW